jgi:N-methylhydantoinase A
MYRIGVDVGGTFTDVILVSTVSGEVTATKVPTTPADPSAGVVNGIREVLKLTGGLGSDVQFIGHGTTIATNLLVEGKGAKAALLATEGFRDSLEIRRSSRHDRADLYDMFFENPRPLVRRRHRREIRERMRHDASVHTPLDEKQLGAELDQLQAQGIEAIAISFMHAYANPAHEQRAADIVRARFPGCFVTTSYEVNPEIGEYERASTTVINALLGPKCEGYLSSLEDSIAAENIPAGVHLMQSNGGLTRPRDAAQRPVLLLESGPAGGATAAVNVCRRLKIANGIMGDVGGTSFDVSVIRNFAPEMRTHTEINSYAVRAPTIDIVSIGAGGGSIASVDAAGGIQVGPHSAGSVPGPACYGRGGVRPTVTDCNLVLGYLDASRPLGGYMLDVTAAERVIERTLATPLGLSVVEAAQAVRAIANAHMAQAIRLVTIERGFDPRDFAYIPFGGGGPVHAVDVAELLEVETIIVPPHPGLFSALGMLVADMLHDFQSPLMRSVADISDAEIRSGFEELEHKAIARMAAASVPRDKVRLYRRVDCRYLGQADSMTVEVPDGELGYDIRTTIRERFMTSHERQWNFTLKRPVMLTNLRVQAVGAIGEYVTGVRSQARTGPVVAGKRRIMMGEAFQDVPSFERSDLPLGFSVDGPAVITEPSTSLALKSGQKAHLDHEGNLVIKLARRDA